MDCWLLGLSVAGLGVDVKDFIPFLCTLLSIDPFLIETVNKMTLCLKIILQHLKKEENILLSLVHVYKCDEHQSIFS